MTNDPSWSDERITDAFVILADDCGYVGPREIMYLIKGMRNDYEAKVTELEAELRDDHLDDFDGLDDDPPCVSVTPERLQAMREVLGLLRPYGAVECDGAVVLGDMLREMEGAS